MLPSAVQQKGQQKEEANGQQQQHATKLLPILVAIDRASLLEKDLLQMQHFAPPLYRSSSNSNGSANSYSEADSPWHCQPPLTISHQQQPQPPRPLTNLSRMLDGFHQFQSLKKGTYSTVDGLRQMPVEADGLYRSQYENYKKICKIVTSLAFDLVDRYFWPFGQLPTDEKLKLFGPFFKMFCNVCRSFRTANRFPPGDDRLFMPDGGYIRRGELHLFFENSTSGRTTSTEVASIFQNTFEYMLTHVVAYMRYIQIQELELIALLGILLWNDCADISPSTLALVRQQRSEVILELHSYYRGLGIPDEEITLKAANLLLLVPRVETTVKMTQEDATISDLFNILTIEEACKELAIV